MIDLCQAEALEQMVMPGRRCIIFPLRTMLMLDVACARRNPVKVHSQLYVQHIEATR